MKLLLSAALLVLAESPELSVAERNCADLRQMLAAARERPPFRSLESRSEDEWFDGESWCRRIVTDRVSWRCGISTADAPEGRLSIARMVQRCLPEAELVRADPEPAPDARLRSGLTLFAFGKTRIEIREHGGPAMHIGWYYNLSVVAPR